MKIKPAEYTAISIFAIRSEDCSKMSLFHDWRQFQDHALKKKKLFIFTAWIISLHIKLMFLFNEKTQNVKNATSTSNLETLSYCCDEHFVSLWKITDNLMIWHCLLTLLRITY